MLKFAIRRLAGTLPTLFIIVTSAFFVIRLAPGGPFDQEQSLPPQIRLNLERVYGLDQPLLLQYGHYLRGLAHGDFGPSFKFKDASVGELIGAGLPLSVIIGAGALALGLLAGIPLGIAAALWRDSFTDHTVSAIVALAIAIPAFVTGPVLALLFGLELGWLPVAGWESGAPQYAILPVVTLALPLLAYIARLMRASLLEVLTSPYIRAARAKGIGERAVILRHALRPALLPVVSYLGPATAFVLTGSLVVETVFGLPGAGRYLIDGAINRDYTLVMGMVIVYGVATLLCNLGADLLYGWLDPRIRYD